MQDDTVSNSAEEPPEIDSEGSVNNGFFATLRGWFGHRHNHTLRASLEDVIESHETDNSTSDIPPDARSMMLNLLRFPDVRVDDVMVPRADIIAIEDEATTSQLLKLFDEANHSRIPIFHETLDDPVGMIHIKDFLRWLTADDIEENDKQKPKTVCRPDADTPINKAGIMREVLYVPPSMPASDLLLKMQSTHIHMAIVVDEYGGTDGLVSIEDVVEEIVGDIADEHDIDEAEMIIADGSGNYDADARAPIEEVEALLKIDLLPDERDEDADTLGGFIFSMLGRVPVRGELVRHESGIEFEITKSDPRRVKKIKIRTRPQKTD